jgi:hypothetical protein
MRRAIGNFVAGLLVFLFAVAMAAQQTAAAGSSNLYAGVVGEWVGQLEYRDYSSNERVFLPTWLAVKAGADGKSAQFVYPYDDGPNKTVKELSTLVLDAAAGTATFTSDREHSSDTYRAGGWRNSPRPGGASWCSQARARRTTRRWTCASPSLCAAISIPT